MSLNLKNWMELIEASTSTAHGDLVYKPACEALVEAGFAQSIQTQLTQALDYLYNTTRPPTKTPHLTAQPKPLLSTPSISVTKPRHSRLLGPTQGRSACGMSLWSYSISR